MARPSSNKGKDGLGGGSKTRTGNRIRVHASDRLTSDLFPDPRSRADGSSPTPCSREDDSRLLYPDDGSRFPEESDIRAEHPEELQPVVPKSLVKFIVALFLTPLAWILTQTFFQAFTTSISHGLLATQSFGCFAAGMILFVVLYLIAPQNALMYAYVFGHEVTHALWAKLFGGRVADHFHVSLEGGHVLTDRVNTWIALAPYFFPIYSLLVITLYGTASLVADISSYRWILFLLLGFTLAFHLIFTCLLIAKGQPDLHYGGTFFSLMMIYLINLLIITCLLLATAREVSLRTFGEDFAKNGLSFLEFCRAMAGWVADWIGDFRAGLAKH